MSRSAFLSMLLLACVATPAAASGTLYRCKGSQGELAYTSNRAGFTDCTLISRYRPEPAKPAPAAPRVEPGRSEPARSEPESGAAAEGEPVAKEPAPAAGAPRTPVVQFRSAPGNAEPASPAALAGLGQPKTTRGAIYRYERDGVLHYTNVRPAARDAVVLFTYIQHCYACGAAPGIDWETVGLNLDAYREEIAQAALETGLDPAFMRAVMHAESAFRPHVVSHKGAQGLMQLMPATAERFGVQDAFDPGQNIAGGARYLAWLLQRFDGDTRLAAAGYNAGEGSVDRHGGVPPFEETQRFVERVGILHSRYRDALP